MTEDNTTSDKDEKRLKIDKLCLLEYACLRDGLFLHRCTFTPLDISNRRNWIRNPKDVSKTGNAKYCPLLVKQRRNGREREGEVGCKQEDEES